MITRTHTIALEQFTTFGDLLRYVRRRAGLTQRELSIAVGYSDAQISRLEQNQRLPDLATIPARFVPALDLDDDPEIVKRLMELAAEVRREDAPATGLPPYKGLLYFDEADADLFFGREALTAKLVSRLLSASTAADAPAPPPGRPGARFLALVGASGSGKSSLLRAGLIPTLRWTPRSAHWPIYLLTPTAHPLEALATGLSRESASMRPAALVDDMEREPRGLHLALRRLTELADLAHVLLVVDQLEEVFTLCRSASERSALVDNLIAAAFEPDGRATVIVALRADFYAHCAEFARLREALAAHQEYIGPMNAGELRQVIEEPARRGQWELEAGLVDLLLQDVGAGEDREAEPGALPLLSHALLETWHRRRGRTLTLGGYLASGGVRGAIAETAEAVFKDQLDREQRLIARHIFLRLTELGEGTQDTRRRAPLSELIPRAEETAAAKAVLKTLSDARLITLSEGAGEVAHEALIREWPTLRQWLAEDREALRLHRQLTEAAQEWERLGRDPGALYRGARLAQALEWAEWSGHGDALNDLEREFLLASKDEAEREAVEREAQRRRELEAAQQLADSAQQLADAERGRAEEQGRAALRLRQRAYLAITTAIGALLMMALAIVFGVQATRSAEQADALAAQADRQRRIALSRQMALQSVNQLNADRVDLALLLAVASAQMGDTFEARSSLLTSLLHSPHLTGFLRNHSRRVTSVALSPDGKTLASGSEDNTIVLWDVAARRPLGPALTGHQNWVLSLAFSPDGQTLAAGDADGLILLWDVTAAPPQPRGPPLAGHRSRVSALAFSPNGQTLASGSFDHTILLWDLRTQQAVAPALAGHTDWVTSLAFSPDGQTLFSGSADHTLRLWDVAARQPRGPALAGHTDRVSSIAISPDGQTLASGSADQTVLLWEVAGRRPIDAPLSGHTGAVTSVAFGLEGMRLISASADGSIVLWDVGRALPQPLGPPLIGHVGGVLGLTFASDGKTLASGGEDALVMTWDVATPSPLLQNTLVSNRIEIQAIFQFAAYVNSVAFSPNGQVIASASSGDEAFPIRLWDAVTLRPLDPPLLGHLASVTHIAFSPDSSLLASGSIDKTVILWDVAARRPFAPPLEGHTRPVAAVAFSPDGKTLASASLDKTITLWNVATGQPLGAPLIGHSESVVGIAFSPGGTLLATSGGAEIMLWDMTTHEPVGAPLIGHTDFVYSVAFSPDGQMLASASDDHTLRLWDMETRQPLGPPLTGHTDSVYTVAFSPDGQTLASASRDGSILLWDVATRQPLGPPLTGHADRVYTIAFSPVGQTLASASRDGSIFLWDLEVEAWQARACRIANRNLTPAEWAQYLGDEPYRRVCPNLP